MKNLKSYRYFYLNENLKIITTKKEDYITITLREETNFIGSCYLDIKVHSYWYFEDDISEEEYNKLFTEDMFLHIENLAINIKYRGKGYAKKLVGLAIDKANELGIKRVFLNAYHISMNKDLPRLIRLYESFGFKVFLHQGDNDLMIKTL